MQFMYSNGELQTAFDHVSPAQFSNVFSLVDGPSWAERSLCATTNLRFRRTVPGYDILIFRTFRLGKCRVESSFSSVANQKLNGSMLDGEVARWRSGLSGKSSNWNLLDWEFAWLESRFIDSSLDGEVAYRENCLTAQSLYGKIAWRGSPFDGKIAWIQSYRTPKALHDEDPAGGVTPNCLMPVEFRYINGQFNWRPSVPI